MHHLESMDVAIVAAFFVLVAAVGLALSRFASRDLEGYFLAGRRLPWWILGNSTAASHFDMAGTMVLVSLVFSLGYKGFLIELRGSVGLSLPFLAVFLAKWMRRSSVMTSAEWMKIRFGTDRQGRVAHGFSAMANVVLALFMIVYFCKGAGAFLSYFLPLDETTCTALMVAVGLAYTTLSGLFGVVFTDLVQNCLILFASVFIATLAFDRAPEVLFPNGFLALDVSSPAHGNRLLELDAAAWEPIFSMFGLYVILWSLRTSLEGLGGVSGYTDQRFFAARTEREASWVAIQTIVLAAFRWMLVAGIATLGLSIVQSGTSGAEAIAQDIEQVLPVVLSHSLPTGVRGLVISGMVAAAMSTFDSTLNAGASVVVRDLYQSYLRPNASHGELVHAARAVTLALCALGVLFARFVPNIGEIWGLITMGLGAGMFVPQVLRWYWPRFNGYGFSAGTAVGIASAMVFHTWFEHQLYISFPVTVLYATLACVLASLFTAPTDPRVLVAFWVKINPWGWWRRIEAIACENTDIDAVAIRARARERVVDGLSLLGAVPFHLSLLLAAMALVFRDWATFGGCALVAGVSAGWWVFAKRYVPKVIHGA